MEAPNQHTSDGNDTFVHSIVLEDDDGSSDDDAPMEGSGSGMPSYFPGIEMSQDCVVWNEKSNTDLRATRAAPHGQAPTGVLDHFVQHRGSNVRSKGKPDASSGPRNGRNEGLSSAHEIAGIFRELGTDHQGQIIPTGNDSGTCEASSTNNFPISAHRNRHSYPPTKKWNRKRPDASSAKQAQAREKAPKLSTNSTSPMPSFNSGQNRSTTMTPHTFRTATAAAVDSSSFDDLLEQIKTPSPNQAQASKAQNTQEYGNHNHNNPQLAATKLHNQSAQSNMTNIRPQALVNKGFQSPPLSGPKAVMDKENVNLSNTTRIAPTQTQVSWNPYSQKHNSKPPVSKLASKKAATVQLMPPPPPAPPAPKHDQVVQSTNPGTLGSSDASQPVPNIGQKSEESSEDEFGDLDFSEELFAQVDSLVAATQQQTQPPFTQQQTQQPTQQTAQSKPAASFAATTGQPLHEPTSATPHTTTDTSITANIKNGAGKKPEDDDIFDDLHDIDFEALDMAIATQQPYVTCTQAASAANSATAPTDAGSSLVQTTTPNFQVPPINAIIQNPKAEEPSDGVSFTRYVVHRVENDVYTYTKTLFVKEWDTSMLSDDRKAIHKISDSSKRAPETQSHTTEQTKPLLLRGSLYYIQVEEGDALHLCSLTGRYKTEASALPVILNTAPPPGSDEDDLVMILHPDMLSVPTQVTKMLGCERRAVVTGRLGSTGMSSKKMLFGTMRHSLFEVAMRERNFTFEFAQYHVKRIVRENAEAMISCNMSSSEAERELIKIWPQLQAFEREFLNSQQLALLKSNGGQQSFDIRFAAKTVTGVEEPVIAPELGLKGNLDVMVEADIAKVEPGASIEQSLMGIELKTNHNTKSQNEHMAQLSLYTMMLLSRFGISNSAIFKESPKANDAVAGGMLLYLNGETLRAEHVSPNLPDVKNLIEQRNIYSSHYMRALRPRGVTLTYEDEESGPRLDIAKAPPVMLPDVQQSTHMCSRCFAARECMLYATAEASMGTQFLPNDVRKTHGEIANRFTEQLRKEDFEYFLEWDRLIDLEADATHHSVAEAWLQNSEDREKATGKSISSLVYEQDSAEVLATIADDDSVAHICLRRSNGSVLQTPFSNLQLTKGSYVTCSTDTTTLVARNGFRRATVRRPNSGAKRSFRHQMHVFRGTVASIEGDNRIVIRASTDDVRRIQGLVQQYLESAPMAGVHKELHFRLDNDDLTSQMGKVRQNLVNLFTMDREEVDEKNRDHRMRHEWMKQRLPWLREAVVHLREPVFDLNLKGHMFNIPPAVKSIPGADPFDLVVEFSELNPDQRAAAEKVTTMKDYSVIQGLPGTGKTSTIVFLARLLAAQGKRVLITSYTHSAVDNVMLKLVERDLAALYDGRTLPALVRIGNESSCHPNIKSLLVPRLAAGLEGQDLQNGKAYHPSAESLRRVMSEARIVGATALTVPRSPLLLSEKFDVVIVDEAGQISQPAVLGALASADRFILVGDHMQLPPLVQSELADKAGYGVSMLKRLADAHPEAVQQLKYQYRMHPQICKLSSDAIYDGKLVTAIEEIQLKLPDFPNALNPNNFGNACHWVKRVINPEQPVVFANTDAITNDNGASASASDPTTNAVVPLESTASRETGGSMINEIEATLVRLIVQGLIATGLSPASIGVICPFRAQIRLLESCPQIRKWEKEGLEISTIDRYQGRDKEAIVLSFVRSNSKGKVGRLLEDIRRVNVAITRAKHKMIMVGSFSTLSKGSSVLKTILGHIQSLGRVELLPRDAVHGCPVMSQLSY